MIIEVSDHLDVFSLSTFQIACRIIATMNFFVSKFIPAQLADMYDLMGDSPKHNMVIRWQLAAR